MTGAYHHPLSASARTEGSSSSAAVCISGQYRTFDAVCAGPLTVRRFIQPLAADVYAFMNAPPSEVKKSLESARRVLHGTRLRALQIEALNCSADGCHYLASKCSGIGFLEARGLRQCGQHVLVRNYSWIVRVRPDALVGFTMPR